MDMNLREVEFDNFDLSSLDGMMEDFQDSQGPDLEEDGVESDNNDSDLDSDIIGDDNPKENFDDDKDKGEPSSQDTKNSPLTPYAKMLVEEGLLPNVDLEKFDGTVESLLEAQREYDLQRFESFKESSLDPRVKWLQDNLEAGVPFERLLELDNQKLSLESISEDDLITNEDLQKDIIRSYYRESTPFSEEKIESLIENLETVSKLESESRESLKGLKELISYRERLEYEEAQKQQAQYFESQKQVLKDFNKKVEEVDELIPGLKVSPVLKDKIKKTLTTSVAVDPYSGSPLNKIAKARMDNPIDFEIKLAYLFELTNGFSDWSQLVKPGKKRAIEEFEKSVESIDLVNKNTYRSSPTAQRTRSYLDEMERISKQF